MSRMLIPGRESNRWNDPRAVMVLLLAVLVCVLGCGGHDLASVAGVVHLDGAPMKGGRILLTPLGEGKPAAGKIQADGSFVLTSYSQDDGAKPGKNRVTIVGERQPRTSWMAPNDYFVEIKPGEKNQLKIDVTRATGWKQLRDD